MLIGVCLKHVSLRVEIDPLSGVVEVLDREAGLSAADEAALETALVLAERWGGEVLAVSVGTAAADAVLRTALGCGAARACRVELETGAPSWVVAAALAPELRDATVVLCGDHSRDRGSGSVPAFLAAELGAAQALGAVSVEVTGRGVVQVTRRLDRGRRDVSTVSGPMVVSVEGAVARLRRASLRATLEADRAVIALASGPTSSGAAPTLVARAPFRPRTRVVPAPAGATALDRVRCVTSASTPTGRVDPVVLTPSDAAATILAALAGWGYPTRSAGPSTAAG